MRVQSFLFLKNKDAFDRGVKKLNTNQANSETIINGTYILQEKIGEGGGGEVFRAFHRNLEKSVVLKRIKGAGIGDIRASRVEADLLKNLRQEYIPQVLDFIEWNGGIYTVMDYIPGYSFQEYLKRGTQFKEYNVREWAIELSETLKYIHGQKTPIIHSDIKPGNIMLTPEGKICLIDFNISSNLKGMGAVVTGATPGYAPPEQLQALQYNRQERDMSKWKTVDARADIYALGASLYHILTGKKAVIQPNGYIMDIRSLRPNLNDVFAAIIMKCLEPNPNMRYQTAAELLEDLKNIYVNDRQYKALLKKQNLTYLGTVVGLFFFAALAVLGYFKTGIDREDRYQMLTRKMETAIESGEYDEIEDYFTDAQSLNPEGVDAWYYRAYAFYQEGEKALCVDFIENEALKNRKLTGSSEPKDSLYYLAGEAYFDLEDFSNAVYYYQMAVDEASNVAEYYRELAIALSWNGQPSEAEEALRQAENLGMDSDSLKYVHAEMSEESNDILAAKNLYVECLSTEDEELKIRAYLSAAGCLETLASDEASAEGYRLEEKELLEQAVAELPEYIALRRKLSSTYLALGVLTGEISYFSSAETTLQNSYQQTYGEFGDAPSDYIELSQIYQGWAGYDESKYTEASQTLKEARDRYPKNYKVYMYSAYLEKKIQDRKDYENPDYTFFRSYYQSALTCYEEAGVYDTDMENLKDVYNSTL